MLVVRGAKGGVGTTVVAAAVALLAAERGPTLVVDVGGDGPATLGLEAPTVGLSEWAAASEPAPDALRRLETEVTDGLTLVGRGGASLASGGARLAVAASLWAADPRTVVVDAGGAPEALVDALLSHGSRAVTVTRNCYLSLRRAADGRMDHGVCVLEPGRALRRREVETALAPNPVLCLPYDLAVARAVDAGLLSHRMPRTLRSLEELL